MSIIIKSDVTCTVFKLGALLNIWERLKENSPPRHFIKIVNSLSSTLPSVTHHQKCDSERNLQNVPRFFSAHRNDVTFSRWQSRMLNTPDGFTLGNIFNKKQRAGFEKLATVEVSEDDNDDDSNGNDLNARA